MIRIVVASGALPVAGAGGIREYSAPVGSTWRELAEIYWPKTWPKARILSDLPVDPDELVPDGASLCMVPPLEEGFFNFLGGFVGLSSQTQSKPGGKLSESDQTRNAQIKYGEVSYTVLAIGAIGYSLWMAFQDPDAQRPGESESPTYSWGGVSTSIGAGHIIPGVWGRALTGGHMIYAELMVDSASHGEFIASIVALSEGRIYGVGGTTGGVLGVVPQMGRLSALGFTKRYRDLPQKLRINGITMPVDKDDDLMLSLRLGEVNQPPLDGTHGFYGVNTIVNVGGDLNQGADPAKNYTGGDEVVHTIGTSEQIARVDFILEWPNGCYTVHSQNGSLYPFAQRYEFSYRKEGATTWVVSPPNGKIPGVDIKVSPQRAATAARFSMNLRKIVGRGVEGPLEVRVRRISNDGGALKPWVSSNCTLRQVGHNIAVNLRYPRMAYAGILQSASELISGAVPQYEFEVWGRTVRVWDVTLGWSLGPKVWDVTNFAFTDPRFSGIWTNPPGLNPAWLCLEFLLAVDGLGPWIKEADIELQDFRNWADNCDGDLGAGAPAGTPRYQFGRVFDSSMTAWEVVQIFARCGRARIHLVGSKIRVDYDYTAAHGRGTNTVPAKVATMLVCDSDCRAFSMRYFPVSEKAMVLQFQFRNAEKRYQRDVIAVEDPDSTTLNAPYKLRADEYTVQTHERFEVTSPTQLHREGLMMHRFNRHVRYGVEFVMAWEALTAMVGDVIEVQSDVVRPFGASAPPKGYRVGADETASATITIDHPIEMVAGSYFFHVALDDGTLQLAELADFAPQSYSAGDAIPIFGTITCKKGAPVVFGEAAKLTLQYQIRQIGLVESGFRKVSAIEWNPIVYQDYFDDLEPDVPATEAVDAIKTDHALNGNPNLLTIPGILSVELDAGLEPGDADLRFQRDPEQPNGSLAKVYMRDSADVDEEPIFYDMSGGGTSGVTAIAAGTWTKIGETHEDVIRLREMAPGRKLDFSVCVGDLRGAFQSASAGKLLLGAIVPEFPRMNPPDAPTMRALVKAGGLLLEWDPVPELMIDHYEIRQGPDWVNGIPIYKGRDLHYLHTSPMYATTPYRLRTISRGRMPSLHETVINSPAWLPPGHTVDTQVIEMPYLSAALGTLVDLTYNIVTQEVELAAGKYVGTYTSTELDLFSASERWFWQSVEFRGREELTVEEWDFKVDSGEARFRFVDDREPSDLKPGQDLVTTVDAGAIPIDSLPENQTVDGIRGLLHPYTRRQIEVRYHDGTAWSAYGPSCGAELVNAQKVQVRITLARMDLSRQVYAGKLVVGASSGIFAASEFFSHIIQLSTTTAVDISASATDNLVTWNTQDVVDAPSYTHSTITDSGQVTVDKTGRYAITCLLAFSMAAGAEITNVEARVRKNGSTDLGPHAKSGIISSLNGQESASLSIPEFVVELTAGDYVEVLVDREAGSSTGTLLDSGQSFLKLERRD